MVSYKALNTYRKVMNKKDKNKTILTIISTSIARKPNLKLPV